jgi:hypothetical protein
MRFMGGCGWGLVVGTPWVRRVWMRVFVCEEIGGDGDEVLG